MENLPTSKDINIQLRSTDMPEDEEFIALQRRLDRHLDEYRLHILEHEKREEKVLLAQEANTKSIAELTAAVKPLVDAMTAAIVLQKFIKWATGFSGVVVFIAWWNGLFSSLGGS